MRAGPEQPRAISIRQPWASAIFVVPGRKNVENRSWATRHTGRLYVHASSRVDPHAPAWVWDHATAQGSTEIPLGVILGHIDVTGCTWDDVRSRWAVPGQCHWLLARPSLLGEPVPYSGQRSLWRFPQELIGG